MKFVVFVSEFLLLLLLDAIKRIVCSKDVVKTSESEKSICFRDESKKPFEPFITLKTN